MIFGLYHYITNRETYESEQIGIDFDGNMNFGEISNFVLVFLSMRAWLDDIMS